MKVRVLRLMEYIYSGDDPLRHAVEDQKRWQVQGSYAPSAALTIHSVVLPVEIVDDDKPNPCPHCVNDDPVCAADQTNDDHTTTCCWCKAVLG